MNDVHMTSIGAAIDTIHTLTEAIRELKSIPNGHLYAMVLGHMSLEQYESAIRLIVRTGLVEKRGDVLTWVGPNL